MQSDCRTDQGGRAHGGAGVAGRMHAALHRLARFRAVGHFLAIARRDTRRVDSRLHRRSYGRLVEAAPIVGTTDDAACRTGRVTGVGRAV